MLLDALGHTAYNAHKGGLAAAHGVELVKPAVYLLLGVVAYRAGVQQYEVGVLYLVAYLVSGYFKDGAYDLAVGNVHLATVCLDK